MPRLRRITLVAAILVAFAASAATIDQPLANPAQEKTAQAIFTQLRCVVCEGQSIAESNAALAAQMRTHVREQLRAGKSEPEILAAFSAAYGEAILMTPPFKANTWLLWLAPLLMLAVGAWIMRQALTASKGYDHD